MFVQVLFVGLPLDDLLLSRSPTLISLATLWVNILLRKAVRIKHWSWAYVLHVLNNEPANVTFDELFRETIQCSREDIATQVFLSVLQNESLQSVFFDFLRKFAQTCITKGGTLLLHKLKNLKLTVSSCVMESSEMKVEFESFIRGEYERVLLECTTPDSSGEPPHLTANLTILLDDADVLERLPTGCSGGEIQPTNSSADDSPPSCEAESISKVQCCLFVSDKTKSLHSMVESDGQKMPNNEKTASKHRQANAIFRSTSFSELNSEQILVVSERPNRCSSGLREQSQNTQYATSKGESAVTDLPSVDLHLPVNVTKVEPSTTNAEGYEPVCKSEELGMESDSNVMFIDSGFNSPSNTNLGSGSCHYTGARPKPQQQHDLSDAQQVKVGENSYDTTVFLLGPGSSLPQLWDTEVHQNSSNFASLTTFILSLPVEVQVCRDAEGKTLCHALVGLNSQGFSSIEVTHLLESLGEDFLQHCMLCQDFSGNTPLHCAIEAKHARTDVVKFLLRFTTCESVGVLNNDSLTPLELSFEKKLWPITQLLLEHQIETEASCAAELLQEYFFKVMKEQGASYFLPHLLDFRERYCPDLDLNFSESRSNRTPWWYLAISTETSVIGRVLQTLKSHSIDFTSLQIRAEHGRNVVEEAEEKNSVLFIMIQTVARQHHNEEDQDTSDNEESSASEAFSQASSSSLSKFDQSSSDQDVRDTVERWLSQSSGESLTEGRDHNILTDNCSNNPQKQTTNACFRHMSSSGSDLEQVGCHKFSNTIHSFPTVAGTSETTLDILPSRANTIHEECVGSSNQLQSSPAQRESKSFKNRQYEVFSESDTTSLEADDSSDGGSERIVNPRRPTRRSHSTGVKHKRPIPPEQHNASKQSKTPLVVFYHPSGYSGDDSDCTISDSICTKSSKFTSAQRAAAIKKKEQFYKDSSSEYSEAETENYPPQMWSTDVITYKTDEELSASCGTELAIQSSCPLKISNCLPQISSSTPGSRMSTELHQAVRHQSLQSVRDILACDGGEDQIQMMDEEGHTPLQIASQNKDLRTFELLLEGLICSQVSSPITLPPCSGHQLMTLLASIVKVLSKKEIDIDNSTLCWTMVSCQHWKIPMAVYATPATVLTMGQLLRIDLHCSDTYQLMEHSAIFRKGDKKKVNTAKTEEDGTQEEEIPSQCESVLVTGKKDFPPELHIGQPVDSDFSTMTEAGLHQICSEFQTQAGPHLHSDVNLDGERVNGTPVQVSSVHRVGNSIASRPDENSLVLDLRTHSQTRTTFGIPLHPQDQIQGASMTDLIPNSTDPTPSLLPATTSRRTLSCVATDSSLSSQPRPSSAELTPHRQVSQSALKQLSADPGIPHHQLAQPPVALITENIPNSTDPIPLLELASTDKMTLPQVVEDSPYSQPKSSAAELTPHRQVSRSSGESLKQLDADPGIPHHQLAQPPAASITEKIPNSTDPIPLLEPASTDKMTLPQVVEDLPHSKPKFSASKQSTHRQDSQSSVEFFKPTGADFDKEVTAWQAWIDKAVNCLHAGDYLQMLEVLQFGKVPPPLPAEIAMAAQFGCALAYCELEKYSEAAKHFQSLKTIAASAQSCGNESIASVYLGDIEFTQSRYTEAAKHYSHALKLYRSDNLGKEYRLIVPTFSAISAKLGTAFRNTSKVVDAVQAYRQAIATADSKKDKLSAHTSLGNLFQSVGENASALAEYEHSIKLSEELRDYVSLGWAHGNMGNAYLGLYQQDKGLYHLEKALDLTVEHEPTPQAIGRAYNNLGTAYQALNELDKAEEKYDLALSQSIYGNDLPGQARVYGNIGNVLMLRKDYDRAVPHYTEVLCLSRDRSTVSTAFHNRGCSYYEWAESKKATLPQKGGFSLHGSEFENCELEHQPSFKSLPNSILKYYQLGRQDLEQVIKYHEETFENIKGSSKGLTLSVSLFETNSSTFHRLQDCLVNLGEWEKALVVAEQSRTRTLGELLVKRKNSKIDHPLTAPLNLQSITDIVQSQHSVVVYLSYTGARLLGWVLAPTPDKVSVDMFEVPLEDDQFDGNSFDYHLRYSLTEELVERSFDMYRAVDYKSDMSEPVRKLYKLVCKPLMKILKELKDPDSTSGVQEMIIIPDSYTCLLPFPCLLDEEDKFLGDSYSFRIMPSLLIMGIVDQLPSVVVQVPADGRSMCVVGNPTIPSFVYNGNQWSLGKLPFATREAEWVANILKTAPILHEQATKDAILMRIMNAKVIHIATHGSASAGFLAFAGMSSARNGETVEAKSILLYPEDIERLSISPALVVLSSCDSARGTVKADGILGMARAFILAGAQAVLTTLWRVPDESASVFMQFFYQYLMDGLKASLALQKSTLSVRCFSKYSQYIHWSGYQLTGEFASNVVKICFIVFPSLSLSQGEGSSLTLQSPVLQHH